MPDGSIVVTGGSKGIGAAVTRELVARGYEVWCLSRSGDAPAGKAMVCDVTDEAAVKACLADCAKAGPLRGLVNNAGVHIGGPSDRLATEDYEAVMRLNATAILVCAREVFPHLRDAGGTIINMGSFFDRMGVPHNLAYCASKAAVGAITRCLAIEWAKHDIRVVNVAPGYVETELNHDYLNREGIRKWMGERVPMGRPGQVDEVGKLVGALFDENIQYLTGETIYMDGGHGVNH
ncbi:MAG: SDR family oxidoreductase [Pseudomonadota bacterium]